MSEPIIVVTSSTPVLISDDRAENLAATERVIVENNLKPASAAIKTADSFHAVPAGSEETEQLKLAHLEGFILNCWNHQNWNPLNNHVTSSMLNG